MRADSFLEDLGIEYETVEHAEVHSCGEAAEVREVDEGQIVKSLIVDREGETVHCLLPGDRSLSEKKFGEHSLVEPERSRELTGQESGTVHPFSSELKHFVDERIFERDRLSFTTGSATEGVLVDSRGFREALDQAGFEYEVDDLVVTRDEDIEELVEKGLDRESASFIVDKGLRSVFFELSEDHEPGKVVDVLEEMRRAEAGVDVEAAEKLLERSENETHLQRMAEELARTGDLPEEGEGFDLEKKVSEVLDENPEAVQDYRDGRESAINYLLGQVMEKTDGRADGGEARDLIRSELDE
ncbi:MAG: YbaK/EbsC family protein [Candidatus Nanohaloarchaea archaeon]